MKNSQILKQDVQRGAFSEIFHTLYIEKKHILRQQNRYIDALNQFEALYGEREVRILSAPGRSEIGGNHTDHQHGEVLAASVNLDTLAVAAPTQGDLVEIVSGTMPKFVISSRETEKLPREAGTSAALIRGILAYFQKKGFSVGGFQAYITSDVLVGSGLSSSASFETAVGVILSHLYNGGTVSPEDIALSGQYAENVYFEKPSGLMDQMACSVGNLVHIDLKNTEAPVIEQVSCSLDDYGYSLCITDTKGSHADLTSAYAHIPGEMKAVAAFFGQEVLLGITEEDILKNMPALRVRGGDRAVLRALHFIRENRRVRQEVEALQQGDFQKFLALVRESGDSSYKYLQNIYHIQNPGEQNIAVALAVSEEMLGHEGACRVHGGGFAGTIQAFVKNDALASYSQTMDSVFGEGACHTLKIRSQGGIAVV